MSTFKSSLAELFRGTVGGRGDSGTSAERRHLRQRRPDSRAVRLEQLESRLCMSAMPLSDYDDAACSMPAALLPVATVQPVAVTAQRAAAFAPPASTFQTISLTGPDVVGKGTSAVYTVKLLQAPGDKTVTIGYATRNIGAKAGVNYTATSGTLTFKGTETEKTISVPVLASSPDQRKPATYAIDVFQAKDDSGKLIPTNGKILNKSLVTRIIDPLPPSAPGSSFQILVKFPDSSLSTDEQAVFQRAAYRWSEIIVGNLSPVPGQLADIEITATAPSIDGEGNILGQAAPTQFRTDATRLPYQGMMEFDSADVDFMMNNNTLYNVILHEMGHVLGFGTIWASKGLISGAGGTTPLYTGSNGLREYRTLSSKPTATGVPLETLYGPGTRDAHWSEAIFDIELMTGLVEAAGVRMPISRMTVGQFQDLGYKVDYTKADSYTIGATSIVAPSPAPASPAAVRGGTWLVSSQGVLPTLDAAVASVHSATQQAFAAAGAKAKPRPAA